MPWSLFTETQLTSSDNILTKRPYGKYFWSGSNKPQGLPDEVTNTGIIIFFEWIYGSTMLLVEHGYESIWIREVWSKNSEPMYAYDWTQITY